MVTCITVASSIKPLSKATMAQPMRKYMSANSSADIQFQGKKKEWKTDVDKMRVLLLLI
jgi:hypothetical protein